MQHRLFVMSVATRRRLRPGFANREINREPVRDLLRAPPRRPPPILPMWLVQPLPHRCLRPGDDRAIGPADSTGQPFLHVLAQPVVGRELRGLRAFRCLLRFPLCDHGTVDLLPAPGRRIAAQFAGDRSRVAADAAGNLTHPVLLGTQQRDLLTLGERQVPARGLVQTDRRHAPSVTEPADPDRPRHPHNLRRLSRRCSQRDLPPKITLHRPRRLRPARRTHRCPQRPIRRPLPSHTHRRPRQLLPTAPHRTPPRSRCCDHQLNPPTGPIGAIRTRLRAFTNRWAGPSSSSAAALCPSPDWCRPTSRGPGSTSPTSGAAAGMRCSPRTTWRSA